MGSSFKGSVKDSQRDQFRYTQGSNSPFNGEHWSSGKSKGSENKMSFGGAYAGAFGEQVIDEESKKSSPPVMILNSVRTGSEIEYKYFSGGNNTSRRRAFALMGEKACLRLILKELNHLVGSMNQ